jgi:hypothetical protein
MNEQHIATLMRAQKALDELIEAYHNCNGTSHDIRKAYRASDVLNRDIKIVAEYDSLYQPSLACAIHALEELLKHYENVCEQEGAAASARSIIETLKRELI